MMFHSASACEMGTAAEPPARADDLDQTRRRDVCRENELVTPRGRRLVFRADILLHRATSEAVKNDGVPASQASGIMTVFRNQALPSKLPSSTSQSVGSFMVFQPRSSSEVTCQGSAPAFTHHPRQRGCWASCFEPQRDVPLRHRMRRSAKVGSSGSFSNDPPQCLVQSHVNLKEQSAFAGNCHVRRLCIPIT